MFLSTKKQERNKRSFLPPFLYKERHNKKMPHSNLEVLKSHPIPEFLAVSADSSHSRRVQDLRISHPILPDITSRESFTETKKKKLYCNKRGQSRRQEKT